MLMQLNKVVTLYRATW